MQNTTKTPFSADDLVLYVQNDRELYETFSHHVNMMTAAMNRAARNVAKANADWHDDPKAEDHAIFHAPDELQFPAAERLKAIAELVLYRLRKTPAGLKICEELQLREPRN